MADYMALFMTATVMPPINAIPAVVAAPPGYGIPGRDRAKDRS